MGGRSRAAAQLLSGQGFNEVYNLAGGIKAWQGAKATGPAEIGMGLISGEEKPAEMLAIVYAMEEGMRTFYELLGERVDDEEASRLFRKMSEAETHHKQAIFDLYRSHGGESATPEAFLTRVLGDVTETGMSTEELIDAHAPDLSSVEDVLMLAMMLEAQGLDLYLRYSQRSEDEDTKSVLHALADEEKSHLAWLGDLLEQSVE